MTDHHNLPPNFRNIHYIDYEGGEHYYTAREYPPSLEKKIKLLHYFMNYMREHLLKAGANIQVRICRRRPKKLLVFINHVSEINGITMSTIIELRPDLNMFRRIKDNLYFP